MSVDDTLKAMSGPLREQYEALTVQEDALRAQLDEITAEKRKAEKVLRITDPEMFPKPETKNGRSNVSEEKLEQILAVMWNDAHATHTIPGLAEATGIHYATAHAAMEVLRARGDARKVGRVPRSDGKGSVLGFKISEHASPRPGGRGVSEERMVAAREAIAHLDGETFTFPLLAEIIDVPKGSWSFLKNALVDEGYIELVKKNKGGVPDTYRMKSDGE